jgi:hypothetical protein
MTYKDILDALVQDSGDAGSTYRANGIRWLNFVRQDAAARGSWKSAKNSSATFNTAASQTDGIYPLTGFKYVIGDEMYNATEDEAIHRDTDNTLKALDANQNEFGPPTLWSDAGMTALGVPQVRFWPIPAATYAITFLGCKALVDVTSADELVSIDPYFGPLSDIGAMISAGLRYYHDLNDNEDSQDTRSSRNEFYGAIRIYSGQTGSDSTRSSRLEPVGRQPNARPLGRLNPSHFDNR